ncbi:unnamed protein product [Linum tenue]|uniref:peroxidase n=1 Tax=Linum tenue TaxID=586396 RepID=A0AAV0QKQ1_9ROSI|nr:unnamed protein product [Linum tenue]
MKGRRGALFDGLLFFSMIMLFALTVHSAGSSSLKVGFYRRSCPAAEYIVRRTVRRAVSQSPGIGAGLIRLHFHDCFVRGCDGSVLVKSLPGTARRYSEASTTPSLVVAAMASSPASTNLPSLRLTAEQLIQNFARKGLSADEMVTLSGAHSIGRARCSSFSDRLYNFNGTQAQDPYLDRNYAAATCPVNGGSDPTVAMDPATPNRLDNRYYAELRAGRGFLTTDQTFAESPATRGYVDVNARYGVAWAGKFARGMGSIDVLTGNQGEIRRRCSMVN